MKSSGGGPQPAASPQACSCAAHPLTPFPPAAVSLFKLLVLTAMLVGAGVQAFRGLPIDAFSQEKIDLTISELKEERDAVKSF